MNAHVLVDAVVQQTMVFIAQLATAGGGRAPLAQVADQVFLELSAELQSQGVTKKVIADMFGMALRTYHRKIQAARQSRTEVGRSVWEAVFEHIRTHEPVAGVEIHRRFVRDDPEVVSGVLNDLVSSGLVYRAGRGDGAVFRAAAEADFAAANHGSNDTWDWLVWLAVYRHGPATAAEIQTHARIPEAVCREALERLSAAGRVAADDTGEEPRYSSQMLEVPLGESRGWEAAVLDHFQAMVAAITMKLREGATRADLRDAVGGSTWSLDVWPEHPLREEARSTLARVRREVEDLRRRIDELALPPPDPELRERVVFYAGQYVRSP
ncbi:MAG TPA: crosslink repair DNA glycosylase YcaQ family protein [Polyangiaceae bacterium]|nr:crosslink repair DNA glycosylase YcaQ family protein [Polyangiaceae bacterium]